MKNKKQFGMRKLLSHRAVAFVSTAVIAGSAIGAPMVVRADQYDDQINQLQQQNNAVQNSLNGLVADANSYQDAINKLQSQIHTLQANIDSNLAEQAKLKQQIAQTQKEIDADKASLGTDLRNMYVDGTPSTIEMLATSKNLSDFVDKQEYRNVIQQTLVTTMQKIAALQKQLKDHETRVEALLKDLQGQRDQLANTQAQQAKLLAYNQQQQANYNDQLKTNNAKIADLRHQQYLANLALSSGGRVVAGDPGHGGYPNYLNNAAQDSLIDPWGMYNRECVSYAAWKVQQTFGSMPYWGGVGNANQWPGDARAAGIPTGSTPRVHSVAIWNVGYYGHAMWVEAVNGDGSIWVSQYNYDFTGHYSEMLVSASMASSLTYIYFQ